ncbi:MAG: hypothetical protein MJZ25_12295 [Fibrobacter sp.]|nr:hypothetical protein [Fibrobacter sp.]
MVKKILCICLILAASALCKLNEGGSAVSFSAGYAQNFTSFNPVADLDFRVVIFPSVSNGLEVGFGALPFQVAFTGDFQTVSDNALMDLVLGANGLLWYAIASRSADEESAHKFMWPVIVPMLLTNGSVYWPLTANGNLGIVNKNRLVTQIITEGFHLKSFTYEDDLGVRYYMDLDSQATHNDSKKKITRMFFDAGIRLSKNFDSDMDFKFFLNVGLLKGFRRQN